MALQASNILVPEIGIAGSKTHPIKKEVTMTQLPPLIMTVLISRYILRLPAEGKNRFSHCRTNRPPASPANA